LDQFSPRQSRPHFKIASIAAAGASQSKDRNDKQKQLDRFGQAMKLAGEIERLRKAAKDADDVLTLGASWLRTRCRVWDGANSYCRVQPIAALAMQPAYAV
jgi:hypothetical protein